MKSVALTPFLIIFLASSVEAADCQIRDYLVQNINSGNLTGETELAFVLTSTREEFDRAKTNGGIGGSYGLISANADWAQSRDRAQRLAEATSFDYKTSYSSSYFSQSVWPGAVEAYRLCLQGNKETPGLHLWLQKREGDYFTLRGFWVGTNVAEPAATETSLIIDGGRVVAKPGGWIKAKTEDIVIKREGNTDMFFSLTVGDQSRSMVIVKDPPTVVWTEQLVTSLNILSAAPAHRNPGCGIGSASDTLYPRNPGGYFVAGTAEFTEKTTDPGRYTEEIEYSPHKVSVRITQSTVGCEHHQLATGVLTVVERFPVPRIDD